jgi:hypothetical protein
MASKVNYVDNHKFLQAFLNYLPVIRPLRKKHKALCKKLLKQGLRKSELPKFVRPQTPDYDFIGECLLKIATHLVRKYTYIGTFSSLQEDMIGDALENAIMYLDNFNPKVSKNPFAYFTQIMTYAFYRRMAKESKQNYIKQKSLESAIDFFAVQGGDSGAYKNTYVKFIRDAKSDIIKDFEESKRNKKKPSNPKSKKKETPGIEKFMVVNE